MIETSYGITDSTISTPTQNNDNFNKHQGVNMAQRLSSNVLERLQPAIELLEITTEL